MEEIMSFYSFFLSKNLVPINISENIFFFNLRKQGIFHRKEKTSFLLVILGTKNHHEKQTSWKVETLTEKCQIDESQIAFIYSMDKTT